MIYGYVDRCDTAGYELMSPKQLTKINLSSAGFSTFMLSGTRAAVYKWLTEHESVEVKVDDPIEHTHIVTLTIEIRRNANLFFTPCIIIMRPTIRIDLIPDSPFTSDPALDHNFRLPLVKKLILPTKNTLKDIYDAIKAANSHSSSLKVFETGVPISFYQPGKSALSAKVMKIDIQRFNRANSFADLRLGNKPSLGKISCASNSSLPIAHKPSQTLLRIARHPSVASLQGDVKPRTGASSLHLSSKSSKSSALSLHEQLDSESSLVHSTSFSELHLEPSLEQSPAFTPTPVGMKPLSVAQRAINKTEPGFRRIRSETTLR